MLGIVTWFNVAKGYGEILAEDGKVYFFTHYELVSRDKFKETIREQIVDFTPSKEEVFSTYRALSVNCLGKQKQKTKTISEKISQLREAIV